MILKQGLGSLVFGGFQSLFFVIDIKVVDLLGRWFAKTKINSTPFPFIAASTRD
jgi:hypothetical protein